MHKQPHPLPEIYPPIYQQLLVDINALTCQPAALALGIPVTHDRIVGEIKSNLLSPDNRHYALGCFLMGEVWRKIFVRSKIQFEFHKYSTEINSVQAGLWYRRAYIHGNTITKEFLIADRALAELRLLGTFYEGKTTSPVAITSPVTTTSLKHGFGNNTYGTREYLPGFEYIAGYHSLLRYLYLTALFAVNPIEQLIPANGEVQSVKDIIVADISLKKSLFTPGTNRTHWTSFLLRDWFADEACVLTAACWKKIADFPCFEGFFKDFTFKADSSKAKLHLEHYEQYLKFEKKIGTALDSGFFNDCRKLPQATSRIAASETS